ncbi:MAG: cephalosporin hydroxylase [Candidatus Omnitrophica bacterium]|nr:cephalosporin hydroxylase [Candidatus Omnitrophota bacterium]
MHKLYYSVPARTWDNTFWFGIPILKCPLDMWIYQETIYSLRPDLIIETGTARGGSALFMAHLCDILNHGKIVTVDIKREEGRPRHGKITYLTGSSTSDEVVKEIGSMIGRDDKVFVILDSDHTMGHVLKELHIYKKFVSMGSYMIVEDSNVNGHPVAPGHGPGPMEAIKKFLSEDKSFIIDKEKEKFFLTFNPRGYLKRVG